MKNVSNELLNKNNNQNDKCIIYEPSQNDFLSNSNNNNIQNNLLYNLNISQNSSNKPKNNFNNNSNIDPRLSLTFKYLDIEKNLPLFIQNNITFTDLLLLTRKDLIDLGLSMIDRNRILFFCHQFSKFAKTYSLIEINSFFQQNKNLYDNSIPKNIANNNKDIYPQNNHQRNNMKNKNEPNELFYYSNGFDSGNINRDKEKDSQQEIEYCNIYQAGRISQSRTNTSSKYNNNYSSNKKDFFMKYQELNQEVDNYINKFNKYKENWQDSRKKYDNLMNSYLVRGKTTKIKNNKLKIKKELSQNKLNKNKQNKQRKDKESLEKLKVLKDRKEELMKKLEKIRDKSNHKKMIIKYLDEN